MSFTDNTGAVVAEYTYDAWGNTISATGTWAAVNPLRYRGYFWDSETGYYWLQTRYYNPQWRRFLNADSLFVAGDVLTAANMYGYCDNNPIMKIDPTGTSAQSKQLAMAITLIALISTVYQLYLIVDPINAYEKTEALFDRARTAEEAVQSALGRIGHLDSIVKIMMRDAIKKERRTSVIAFVIGGGAVITTMLTVTVSIPIVLVVGGIVYLFKNMMNKK